MARASLEEFKLDYEDFLRQNSFALWLRENPLRQSLIDRRCQSADEVAKGVVEVYKSLNDGKSTMSTLSTKSTVSTKNYAEYSANAVLVLLSVACALLDRQVKALAVAFEDHRLKYRYNI